MSLEVKMTHCLKPFTSTIDGGGIYVMNADGSKQPNTSNNPASDSSPDWGPAADTDP